MLRQEVLPCALPLIPIRNRVLFPGSVVRLNIGRPKSLKVVDYLLRQSSNGDKGFGGSSGSSSQNDDYTDDLLIYRKRGRRTGKKASSSSNSSSSYLRKRNVATNFVLLSTLYTRSGTGNASGTRASGSGSDYDSGRKNNNGEETNPLGSSRSSSGTPRSTTPKKPEDDIMFSTPPPDQAFHGQYSKDGASSSQIPKVYKIGILARVTQLSRTGKGLYTMLVEGITRVSLDNLVTTEPFCVVKYNFYPNPVPITFPFGGHEETKHAEKKDSGSRNFEDRLEKEIRYGVLVWTGRHYRDNNTNSVFSRQQELQLRQLGEEIYKIAQELMELLKPIPKDFQKILRLDPESRIDILCALLDASVDEKQRVLAAKDVLTRGQLVKPLLSRQVEVLRINSTINSSIQEKLRRTQREFLLRQQLKAIKEELAKLRGSNSSRSSKSPRKKQKNGTNGSTLDGEKKRGGNAGANNDGTSNDTASVSGESGRHKQGQGESLEGEDEDEEYETLEEQIRAEEDKLERIRREENEMLELERRTRRLRNKKQQKNNSADDDVTSGTDDLYLPPSGSSLSTPMSSSPTSPMPSTGTGEEDEIEMLERRLIRANLPLEGKRAALRELSRLKRMPPSQPEHSMLLSYLECLADLPWRIKTQDRTDIGLVQEQLDADHYGLPKVKQRIVEFIAVRTLQNQERKAFENVRQRYLQNRKTYLQKLASKERETTNSENKDAINPQDKDTHANAANSKSTDPSFDIMDKALTDYRSFLKDRTSRKKGSGPILCLIGPPGVGKTSLGRSIAIAMGRKFQRLSLGGVHDEAEIRGHRRTYIGSMPGQLIQSIRKAKTRNPVVLLDEIDKLGRDVRGDPSAALLEVLDGEQNDKFVDHYINTPFDLSDVLFIATANREDTIPPPLLDRMEVIRLGSYTDEEKLAIAKQHLIPKQLRAHGLKKDHVFFPDLAIHLLATGYAREAGVRTLERNIAAMCRFVAVYVARSRKWRMKAKETSQTETSSTPMDAPKLSTQMNSSSSSADMDSSRPTKTDAGNDTEMISSVSLSPSNSLVPSSSSFDGMVITKDVINEVLGPVMFDFGDNVQMTVPGVVQGLAWTTTGGKILYIEASLMSGSGKLTLTGQLGDVMKESAQTALSWVRANATALGIGGRGVASTTGNSASGNHHHATKHHPQHHDHHASESTTESEHVDPSSSSTRVLPIHLQPLLQHADVHLHFPAGAIPKDGPSAGCAIVSALYSCLTGVRCRADTAVTGEVTLRGQVFPVGGIKEKLLGAFRAGVRRVCIPRRNERHLSEIPVSVRKKIEVILCDTVEDVLRNIIEGGEHLGLLTSHDMGSYGELATELLSARL